MKFFLGQIELDVFESVYEPSDDSYLLAETIYTQPGLHVLDIGCGTGIQSIVLALQGAIVLSVDKNPKALENTLHNAELAGVSDFIKTLKSDLFSNIPKETKFDIIVFNPPYVASEGKTDIALDGGKQGKEVLHKFLDTFSDYLKKDGVCFFLQSSLNNFEETQEILKKKGFFVEILNRQNLFMEELVVFRVY